MDKYIKFTDVFRAVVLDEDSEKKAKDFMLLFGGGTLRKYKASSEDLTGLPKSLGVKIAATHAGKVTENLGFYLPDKMRTGTNSWLHPFPKPILLHHDKMDDAIGRVRNAEYVDISHGFRQDSMNLKRAEKIVGDFPADNLIDAFLQGKLTPQECVDVVRNVFVVKDFNFTRDQDYPGLGYIALQASITDPDSVRKVLDERYLTGSIGARSDAAVCSVCKKDWVKDGMCDHYPGKEYDGILCVVIAGNLLYDEYSYVNRPADVHSKNLEVYADGKMLDSRESFQTDAGKIPEVWFNFDDSITEFSTQQQQKKTRGSIMDKETLLKLLQDKIADSSFVLPESIKVETVVDLMVAEENSQALKDATENLEDKELSLTKMAEEMVRHLEAEGKKTEGNQDNLEVLKQELGEDYVDLVGENPDESDILYAEQVADVKMGRVEDMSDEEKQSFLDAKLSSAQRKKLSSSTFCGPNKSFPVPDCAHVTAARRLIGRYKGPGDKKTILACVSRKAKRLGCDSKESKKKDDVGVGIFTPDYFDHFSDTEVLQINNGLNVVLEERELESNDCQQIRNTVEVLRQENEELKNRDSSVSTAAQEELANTLKTLEGVQDQLVKSQEEIRRIRATHVVSFKVLSGEEVADITEAVTTLMAEPDEVLETQEKELRDALDVEKVQSLFRDGLARNLGGGVVVSDPTLRYTKEDKTVAESTDSIEGQQQSVKPVTTKEELDQIMANYVDIRLNRGRAEANMYIEDLKQRGILPKECPVPTE